VEHNLGDFFPALFASETFGGENTTKSRPNIWTQKMSKFQLHSYLLSRPNIWTQKIPASFVIVVPALVRGQFLTTWYAPRDEVCP
jgi:hypothetical protein